MRSDDEREQFIRGVPEDAIEAARALRRRSTAAERALWEALRGRQLAGLKFRRQHAVGPYVLDFWCPACGLAVELDGSVHDKHDRARYDVDRTEQIEAYGYRVIRFRNDEVFGDLNRVLRRILAACGLPAALTPQPPLPTLGEGAVGSE